MGHVEKGGRVAPKEEEGLGGRLMGEEWRKGLREEESDHSDSVSDASAKGEGGTGICGFRKAP